MATRSFKILTSPTNVAAGFWCFSRVKKKTAFPWLLHNQLLYYTGYFHPLINSWFKIFQNFFYSTFFFLSRYVDLIELWSQKPWGAFFNWVIVSDHSITTSHRVSFLNKKKIKTTPGQSQLEVTTTPIFFINCVFTILNQGFLQNIV